MKRAAPKRKPPAAVTVQEIGKDISMDAVMAIFERALANPVNPRGISRSLTLSGGKGKGSARKK